ncbi:hypothetical protein J4Q44_G00250370 [Coregonus suidteri]|uniref:Uncharacterized protein n=1 Tax=Coregonus suidteri TaxID=861788 RepID=A0AAN8LJ46_9TELE
MAEQTLEQYTYFVRDALCSIFGLNCSFYSKSIFKRTRHLSAVDPSQPRGENVSEFLPHPHFILMVDCFYYAQSVKHLAGPETCII